MGWQQDFKEFEEVFHRFSDSLHKENLDQTEQAKLVENLNRTVETGWKALQKFMHQEDYSESRETIESISQNGFASDLEELKKTFERDENIKLKHDRSYLLNNEWEVREVVYPAFKDLHDFLEKQMQN